MESSNLTIDHILIQSKVISKTSYSEILDGKLKESNERVLLHRSSFKIGKNSPCQKYFAEFVETNKNILNEGSILGHGIDEAGFAYIIYNYFESSEFPIEKRIESSGKEIERLSLYVKALQQVDLFHENGTVLGDISRQSFRVTDGSNASFFGYFGSDKYEPAISKMQFEPEFAKYLSPEQKMGAKNSVEGDVYALGILGYILLCGEDAIHESSSNSGNFLRSHQAPSILNSSIPAWLDKVIGSCLVMDPKKRIKSALDILSYLEIGLRDNSVDLPEITWSSDELIVQSSRQVKSTQSPTNAKSVVNLSSGTTKSSEKSSPKKEPVRAHKPKVSNSSLLVRFIWGTTIVGLTALVIGLMISFRVIQIGDVNLPAQFVKVEKEIEAFHLKADLLTFLSKNEVEEVKLKALKSLFKKDLAIDRATTEYLASVNVKSPETSEIVKESLFFWLEKFGYEKVKAEITEKINSGIYSQQPFNFFEISNLLFSSIDSAAPELERVSSLRKLFVKDEIFSFRLVATLIEESSALTFIPVFKDFLSSRGFNDIPQNSSKRSLFILLPETRSLVGENLEKLLKESSNDDLKSIATALLSNTASMDKDFFKQALGLYLEQIGMSKFSMIFVDQAQTEASNGNAISIPLYKLALGTAKLKDLEVFIEWNSNEWERICYAILATSQNRETLNRAMDILSRRSPKSPIAKPLIEWVRTNFWSERYKYGYAIGVFSMKEIASPEELEKAFQDVLPAARSGLFRAFNETGDEYFIKEAALRIAPVATPKEIFELLLSPIAEARISGIKALAGKNDLESLQKILKAYKNEKDPEVIKVYNDIHWVTKDRQLPGKAQ